MKYRGFTLVELLVALALFTIVMMLAMTSLIKVLDMNKKSRSMEVVMNNFNYTLEAMTRDIRFGHNYQCQGSPCSEVTVDFNPEDPNVSERSISYRLSGDDPGRIERCNVSKGSPCTGDWTPITSAQVDVTDLDFYVSGNASTDGRQPRMTIRLAGVVGEDAYQSDFTIQTAVNQRQADPEFVNN